MRIIGESHLEARGRPTCAEEKKCTYIPEKKKKKLQGNE